MKGKMSFRAGLITSKIMDKGERRTSIQTTILKEYEAKKKTSALQFGAISNP